MTLQEQRDIDLKAAEDVLGKMEVKVQTELRTLVLLIARSIRTGNEMSKDNWFSQYAGAVSILSTLDMVTVEEAILLNNYGIEKARDIANTEQP